MISSWFLHMLLIFSSSWFRNFMILTLNYFSDILLAYIYLISFSGDSFLFFLGVVYLSPNFCCLFLALSTLLRVWEVEDLIRTMAQKSFASAAAQLSWMPTRLRPKLCGWGSHSPSPVHREGLQILFKCRFWLGRCAVDLRLCTQPWPLLPAPHWEPLRWPILTSLQWTWSHLFYSRCIGVTPTEYKGKGFAFLLSTLHL